MTVIRTIYITQRELQHFKKNKKGEKKKTGKGAKPPFEAGIEIQIFTDSHIFNVMTISVLGDAAFCRINKINVESILYAAFNPNARKIVIM